MPPRYTFWTILIDRKPTAFRAREKEELLPTLQQLRRTNKDVVMKWFARGRLWETPEEASAAQRKKVVPERRGHQWRPGGAHKDPRERFKKRAKRGSDTGAAKPRRDVPSEPTFTPERRESDAPPMPVDAPRPAPPPRPERPKKKPEPSERG